MMIFKCFYLNSRIYSAPAIADVNDDGEQDIIFANFDGEIVAISPVGEILDGFPVITDNQIWGAPAVADLDNDGDLEIITNNIDDKISFFENTSSESTNYLSLRFRGLDKNLNGLGVRVYVNANDQHQMQELTLSRGFQSSVSPRMHFGLENSETIQEIKIQWPSGKSEVLTE